MKNLKKLSLLIVVLFLSLIGISQPCSPGYVVNSTSLIINNNRNCDVNINWEVSDCIVTRYCNSRAQTGAANLTGTMVIQANTSLTVDISMHNIGSTPLDCSFYTTGNSYDVEVYLFEIDYDKNGGSFWGAVSNGCGGSCFSTTQTAGGTAPASCSSPSTWSMNWFNTASGIQVDIN
jgi:hypothetical protein